MKVSRSWNISGGGQGGAELALFHVLNPAERQAAGRFLCTPAVIVSPFLAADAGGGLRRPLCPD